MMKKTDEDFWSSWAILNSIIAALLSCAVAFTFINHPTTPPTRSIILIGVVVIIVATIWQSFTFRKLVSSPRVVTLATAIGWTVSFVIISVMSANAGNTFRSTSQAGNATVLITIPSFFVCVAGIAAIVMFVVMTIAKNSSDGD